jgi:AAA domain, putative AbiEii toxin, Type IV TA system
MTPQANTTTKLAPLRIEIGGVGSACFKSIDHVVWDNIPELAILTGLNGSGKTQLLELLAYKLTGTSHPEVPDLERIPVTISGDTFGADAVAYLPCRWDIAGAPGLGIAQMQSAKQQLYNDLRQINIGNDMAKRLKRARLERLLGIANLEQIDQAMFVKRLPDDFAFMLDETDVTAGLVHVFLAYRLRFMEALERGTSREDILSKLGPAPWEVVNETFQAAEFPYQVISPMKSGILDNYQLLLEDPHSGRQLWPMNLSSGEKMLLGLVLWLYNSQHHGRFPRLFLMDEPDAYLHPSMARHFLSVVKEVLVDRYHVRVILVTHSPSTVALAPEESLFEMSRTTPRISRSKSKADTIGLLTAGLVIVSPGTRYVLVEDEPDVEFYNTIRDVLSDYGPSRDPRSLKPSPTLVFLPASLGTGKAKVAGGKSVVKKWVEKFDQPPLDEIFRGVIDRNGGNSPTERVHVLSRYSIENYLLDPFVVFGVLLDQGASPAIAGMKISQGDEQRVRTLPESDLQSIVNVIRSRIEPALLGLTATEQTPHLVTFTTGKTVEYPKWMIDRRGHDLLPMYQSVFGGPNILSPPNLYRSLRRVRLIPSELADILERLQD